MKVINNKTGQVEEIAPEQAGNAYLSGEYNLMEGEPVYLASPNGGLDKYKPEDVYGAVKKAGYTFPSAEQIKEHESKEKYADRPLESAALAAGDTATFGMLTRGLVGTGAVSPETITGLREENPIATGVGTVGGIAGSLLAAPEAAALKITGEAVALARASKIPSAIIKAEAEYNKIRRTLVAADAVNPISAVTKIGDTAFDVIAAVPESATRATKIGRSMLGGAAQGAIEGAAFTVGDINREHALGNPNITKDQIISDLGFSAVLSGALNSVARGAITAAKVGRSGAFAEAIRDSTAEATSKMAPSIDDTLKAATSKVPTDIDEVGTLLKDYKVPEDIAELPGRKRLVEITHNNPDLPPVLEPQFKALESETDRVKYSNFLERGEGSENFLKWEAYQKHKGLESLNKQISDLAGGNAIDSPNEAANKLAKDFLTDYETKKKSLSPVFEKIKNVTTKSSVPPSDMITMLEESVPEASKFLKIDPDTGLLVARKYAPGTGINTTVHKAIKNLATVVNSPDSTVNNLWLFRQELDDLMYQKMAPTQKKMISDMRKMLLDVIDKSVPDAEVRNTFKEYAINETKMDAMEYIFGGKIRPVIGAGKPFIPSKAIGKIFSNEINAEMAKSALGPARFNEAVGHHLAAIAKQTTDEAGGGFSSRNFFNKALRNKQDILNVAFKDSPESLQKIYDTLDYMRILPDKPSANPSGTAKSMWGMVKAAVAEGGYDPIKIVGKIAKDVSESKMLAADISEMMRTGAGLEVAKGAAKKYEMFSVLNAMNKLKERSLKSLSSKADAAVKGGWAPGKSVFTSTVKRGPGVAAATLTEVLRKNKETKDDRMKQYEKTSRNLNKLMQSPSALMESLEKMTEGISEAAPATSAALQATAIKGIQFLSSKMPQKQTDSLFQEPYKPSDYEVSTFMTYKKTVDAPLSVLDSLKDNTISVQQIEALNAVYPDLYKQMKFQVMEKVISLKSPPSYQKKLALSMFLGVDVDSSLKPQMIMANQQSFMSMKNGEGQQQQTQGIKPTAKGLSNINLSERSMMPMDKSATRNESR